MVLRLPLPILPARYTVKDGASSITGIVRINNRIFRGKSLLYSTSWTSVWTWTRQVYRPRNSAQSGKVHTAYFLRKTACS